mmetsp:Transcript_29597/g.87729  ORF Transcript_29597/g.87729 Transcript_29597/m.87729 type:complete len:212 (-) Transcript_29597:461-1096(-)
MHGDSGNINGSTKDRSYVLTSLSWVSTAPSARADCGDRPETEPTPPNRPSLRTPGECVPSDRTPPAGPAPSAQSSGPARTSSGPAPSSSTRRATAYVPDRPSPSGILPPRRGGSGPRRAIPSGTPRVVSTPRIDSSTEDPSPFVAWSGGRERPPPGPPRSPPCRTRRSAPACTRRSTPRLPHRTRKRGVSRRRSPPRTRHLSAVTGGSPRG